MVKTTISTSHSADLEVQSVRLLGVHVNKVVRIEVAEKDNSVAGSFTLAMDIGLPYDPSVLSTSLVDPNATLYHATYRLPRYHERTSPTNITRLGPTPPINFNAVAKSSHEVKSTGGALLPAQLWRVSL